MLHHRLFAVDVFFRVHGVDADFLMPVIGSADDDRIDIRARQDFFVVLGGEDVPTVLLLHMDQAAVVAVTSRNELGQLGGRRRLGVSLAHASTANEGNLDLVVGGNFLSRGIGHRSLFRKQRHPETCRCGSSEEVASCSHRFTLYQMKGWRGYSWEGNRRTAWILC